MKPNSTEESIKLSDQVEEIRERFTHLPQSIWELPLAKYIPWIIIFFLSIGIGFLILLLVTQSPRWYILGLFFFPLLVIFILIYPYLGVLLFYSLTFIRIEDKIWGVGALRLSLAVGVVTLLGWLLSIFRGSTSGGGKNINFVQDKRNFLIVGLWFFMALSVWFTDNRQSCWSPFIFFSKIFFFYFVTINLIKTKKQFDLLVWMTILTFGLLCITRLLSHIIGGYTSPIEGPGIRGPMTDTNHFAAALSMVLPMVFYFLWIKKGIIKKIIL